jgi:hypothetical protein
VSRTRKQSKGEPSRVVRALTDRARKVASGRGKAVVTSALVIVGLAGLGAVGWGLWGNADAEAERAQNRTEAASAGWSADRWQEAEPVEGPSS